MNDSSSLSVIYVSIKEGGQAHMGSSREMEQDKVKLVLPVWMLLRVAIHRGKCGASGLLATILMTGLSSRRLASIMMSGQTRNFDVSPIFRG